MVGTEASESREEEVDVTLDPWEYAPRRRFFGNPRRTADFVPSTFDTMSPVDPPTTREGLPLRSLTHPYHPGWLRTNPKNDDNGQGEVWGRRVPRPLHVHPGPGGGLRGLGTVRSVTGRGEEVSGGVFRTSEDPSRAEDVKTRAESRVTRDWEPSILSGRSPGTQ